MSLAVDRAGSVWAGMQDWAVWNRTVNANGLANWRQYTVKDGLGDNDAYAVASDHQGRVWVGHLNHGVSVFNGETWKNYGVYEGPQGERIFDIAVCPTDGDVWIASDAGLARYSDSKDQWTYFSRADGMTSDQINAIAFDQKGNIYCGTQADGLTLAHAAKNYTDWHAVQANTVMPRGAKGTGLPSNIINDVLVAHGTADGVGAGFVYVATINGLAWSRDQGASWEFVRGNDWRANLAGRLVKVAPIEVAVDEDELLLQDWVTCLTEDRRGLVWVGHLRKGFEARDPRSMHTTFASAETPLVPGDEDFIRTMLDTPNLGFLVGRYGNPVNPGVSSLRKRAASPDDITVVPLPTTRANYPRFPSPAAPLSTAQLNAMTERLRQLKAPLLPGDVTFLGDDWATQGDWVGRYGRGHATLAAMDGGANEPFTRLGTSPDHVLKEVPGYEVSEQNGPHDKAGTVPWITWPSTTIPRALYNPLVGHRRHAEWNDLSNFLDMYPWEWDGPDIWITVRVPEGLHRASIYSYNKDGQRGHDRYRDFPIEVKRAPDNTSIPVLDRSRRGQTIARSKTLLAQLDTTPTLARARITDFWGGVYKQFSLCGPATFYFKVGRNHSNGVLISGVFLDPITEPKAPPQPAGPLSWMNGVTYDAPKVETARDGASGNTDSARLLAAQALWAELDAAAWKKSGSGVQRPMRLQALRAAIASGGSPSLLANWRWKLGLWNEADRTEWQATMDRAFPTKIY